MENKELEEFVDSTITPTAAFNIIIKCINVALESGVYDEIDQTIIKKALSTIKEKSDAGKNFTIKVK